MATRAMGGRSDGGMGGGWSRWCNKECGGGDPPTPLSHIQPPGDLLKCLQAKFYYRKWI
uniref:Uncharacterized protein n=1 Tax=Oryza rufipogon TaxID=4529 RepID=A0A0E0QI12_ORYRU